MGNYYGTGTMMTGGFWVWLFVCVGFLFMLLVIVGLVFIFLGLIRHKPRGPRHPIDSPLDILNRRYAAGEIDKEEFEQRKKDLS
jgi:putative membrane protein